MQKVLIIGMGVSGKAASQLLQYLGKEVIAFDDQRGDGAHLDISKVDLAVVSPGIPPCHPLYKEAHLRGIPVIGEAELALSYLHQMQPKQRCLGVTGTNGKTTVTMLIEHVLCRAGLKAKALGNMGIPLSAYAMHPNPDEILVVELSSYQLETLKTPIFDGAVLLNVTSDHLDRYSSLEEYAKTKYRLGGVLKPSAPFFVHPQVMESFGCLESIASILSLPYRRGKGHDEDNINAAWALCQVMGVSSLAFQTAVGTFKKPPHRIEWVREINGIQFFDDSKGTNVDAVLRAAESMPGPVILIVGGVDKGGSYLPWQEHLTGKVKRMIAIGEAAPQIMAELRNAFEIVLSVSLETAVQMAYEEAEAGDCILLSPGCASYDMFTDYIHRGETFKKIVFDL